MVLTAIPVVIEEAATAVLGGTTELEEIVEVVFLEETFAVFGDLVGKAETSVERRRATNMAAERVALRDTMLMDVTAFGRR